MHTYFSLQVCVPYTFSSLFVKHFVNSQSVVFVNLFENLSWSLIEQTVKSVKMCVEMLFIDLLGVFCMAFMLLNVYDVVSILLHVTFCASAQSTVHICVSCRDPEQVECVIF